MINNKILVIDDDIDSLKGTLIKPLKRSGYRVETISDPYQAIRLCKPDPDVDHPMYGTIFIDFRFENFTDINGAMVCKKIRKISPYSTLIILSGQGRDNWNRIGVARAHNCIDKGDLNFQIASEVSSFLNSQIKIAYESKKEEPLFTIQNDIESGKKDKAIKDRIDLLRKIEEICQKKKTKADSFNAENIGHELDMSNLRNKFSLAIKNSTEAMLMLSALKQSQGQWENVKNELAIVNKFVKYFDL